MGDVQFLAPSYSQLPGELIPKGFYSWTNTWMWRFRDVYLVPWKLEDEEIHVEDMPAYAFDSEEERQRISDVLDEYNDSLTISADENAHSPKSRGERTARHPLRTYFTVPLKRATHALVHAAHRAFAIFRATLADPRGLGGRSGGFHSDGDIRGSGEFCLVARRFAAHGSRAARR